VFKFIVFILLTVLVISCSSQKEVKSNKKELEVKKDLKINDNTETTQIFFLQDKHKYPESVKNSQLQITKEAKKGQELTKEYDFNSDGKMDMMVLYTQKGEIDKIYSDLDFDLKHDVIDFYKNNKKNKRELLSDLTKKPHITIFYNENGKITSTLFDRNLDGKPDQKSLYKNGVLYEVQLDSNSDGKFNITKKIAPPKSKDEDGK